VDSLIYFLLFSVGVSIFDPVRPVDVAVMTVSVVVVFRPCMFMTELFLDSDQTMYIYARYDARVGMPLFPLISSTQT